MSSWYFIARHNDEATVVSKWNQPLPPFHGLSQGVSVDFTTGFKATCIETRGFNKAWHT